MGWDWVLKDGPGWHEGRVSACLTGGRFGEGRLMPANPSLGTQGFWRFEGSTIARAEACEGWTVRCTCGWVGATISRALTTPGARGGFEAHNAYLSGDLSVWEALRQVWSVMHINDVVGPELARQGQTELDPVIQQALQASASLAQAEAPARGPDPR